MISTYRMFQMILGIVISVFILYFLVQYSSNYAGFQEDVQRVTIMRNLKTTAESVHTYGNPVDFPDTSLYDFSSCRMAVNRPEPPEISCGFGEVGPVLTPMLFSARDGEGVVVDRAEQELGWHVIYWIESMPESRILFNPLDSSEETWELMETLTSLLPSTENLEPKVTFGFCDGGSLMEDLCGGPCEKYGFLEVLESGRAPAGRCTARLSGDHMILTISAQCRERFAESGVCVTPPSGGAGLAYIRGSDLPFVYKDPFDIIALLIGGSGKDPFGKTYGERLYDYKNQVWTERLSLAAAIMEQRALLVSGGYQSSGEYQECVPLYSGLASALDSVQKTLKGDYRNQDLMIRLSGELMEADSLYRQLVSLGCEYYA